MDLRSIVNKELEELKPIIDTAKTGALCDKFNISYATLTKYLVGKGSKIDLYELIINHFKSLKQ
jgi:hypothetical protein